MPGFTGSTVGAGPSVSTGTSANSMTPQMQNNMFNAGMWGGIGSGLYNMFGASNPSDAASGYLNQIPGTISPYYNPYIQAGQGALGSLQGQYGNLLNDPGALMSHLAGGYKQSPGYQWNLNQAEGSANNAAAAGGMAGSPQHQQIAGTIASGLASQDYNNYLQNVLGLYGRGLQGQEGLNQMGYGASDSLARQLSDALQSQSKLGYAGSINQNQQQGGGMGSLLSGLGGLFMGGPAGAGIGASLGKFFG
jgi:hypothetical protein